MNQGWRWTIELFTQKEGDWKRDRGRELVLVSICQSWDLESVCSYGCHTQERVKITTYYSSISRAYLFSYLCHRTAKPTCYRKQNKECENTIGWKNVSRTLWNRLIVNRTNCLRTQNSAFPASRCSHFNLVWVCLPVEPRLQSGCRHSTDSLSAVHQFVHIQHKAKKISICFRETWNWNICV